MVQRVTVNHDIAGSNPAPGAKQNFVWYNGFMTLTEEIKNLIEFPICSDEVKQRILTRLKQGNLTREENPVSHFCAYFLPYDPKAKKIFIGHHKKSGLWLSPGGHIDRGENLLNTVEREIKEELGITMRFPQNKQPELITITDIKHDVRPCKEHFDFWFFIETDGHDSKVDYAEYHEVHWVTVAEARQLIIDKQNLLALEKIENSHFRL